MPSLGGCDLCVLCEKSEIKIPLHAPHPFHLAQPQSRAFARRAFVRAGRVFLSHSARRHFSRPDGAAHHRDRRRRRHADSRPARQSHAPARKRCRWRARHHPLRLADAAWQRGTRREFCARHRYAGHAAKGRGQTQRHPERSASGHAGRRRAAQSRRVSGHGLQPVFQNCESGRAAPHRALHGASATFARDRCAANRGFGRRYAQLHRHAQPDGDADARRHHFGCDRRSGQKQRDRFGGLLRQIVSALPNSGVGPTTRPRRYWQRRGCRYQSDSGDIGPNRPSQGGHRAAPNRHQWRRTRRGSGQRHQATGGQHDPGRRRH